MAVSHNQMVVDVNELFFHGWFKQQNNKNMVIEWNLAWG